MTFLERIGIISPIPAQKSPEPNGKKKWGTPEYKNGIVYIYCYPEDKERARLLAKELNIPMNVLIHRLLHSAEIAVPNKTKVLSLNGAAFWEMFDVTSKDGEKNDNP